MRVNKKRRVSRGFSLIELGIVIAVIAVLAAVVIFGRGFILAARVTKAVDASNTLRKAASAYAGVNGGVVLTSTKSEIGTLADRSLISVPSGSSSWTVTSGVTIIDVRFGPLTAGAGSLGGNGMAVTYQFDTATMAQDFVSALTKDPNFVSAPSTSFGPYACQPQASGAGAKVTVCFSL